MREIGEHFENKEQLVTRSADRERLFISTCGLIDGSDRQSDRQRRHKAYGAILLVEIDGSFRLWG